MTAKEFWKKKFDEYPQTDAEKLAVVMMTEYFESQANRAELEDSQDAIDWADQIMDSQKLEIERLKGLIESLHTDAFGISPDKWIKYKSKNNL